MFRVWGFRVCGLGFSEWDKEYEEMHLRVYLYSEETLRPVSKAANPSLALCIKFNPY